MYLIKNPRQVFTRMSSQNLRLKLFTRDQYESSMYAYVSMMKKISPMMRVKNRMRNQIHIFIVRN